MLLLEYINDIILIKKERAVKLRKEFLWKLAEDLIIAFNLTNPLTHILFKNAKKNEWESF